MRVSWLTSCPSARTEIHEVSFALMTSLSEGAAVADGFAVDFGKVRTVTSLRFTTVLLSLSLVGSAVEVAVVAG